MWRKFQFGAGWSSRFWAALACPAQAARWQAGATEARSHLMQERGLEVAVERLLSLMTNGEPLEHSLSATK